VPALAKRAIIRASCGGMLLHVLACVVAHRREMCVR
jgi:hypothetical protein